MILLVLIAAATPAPQPSELKLFKDWTVGCDNGRACTAIALMPEDMPDGAATMTFERGAEGKAVPRVHISVESGKVRGLAADGGKLAVRLVDDHGTPEVAAADFPALLTALREAGRIEALDDKGNTIGTVSLAGATAAMLYMDERQQRVGTATALVRPGSGPAGTVPAPPPLPVLRAAPISKARPIALGAGRVRKLRKDTGCEIEEVGGPDEIEVHALDARRSLVLLACGSGAYNISYAPMIAEMHGGAVRISPAPFDRKEPEWENGQAVLVNADWGQGHLSSFAKGRGLGDCGVAQDYVWDGAMFRLSAQHEMGECRGSTEMITTWRTEVVKG